MSKVNKQRNKRKMQKAIKGQKTPEHFAEGQQHFKCPHQQVKPSWARPSGNKGWWNTKPKTTSKEDSGEMTLSV